MLLCPRQTPSNYHAGAPAAAPPSAALASPPDCEAWNVGAPAAALPSEELALKSRVALALVAAPPAMLPPPELKPVCPPVLVAVPPSALKSKPDGVPPPPPNAPVVVVQKFVDRMLLCVTRKSKSNSERRK